MVYGPHCLSSTCPGCRGRALATTGMRANAASSLSRCGQGKAGAAIQWVAVEELENTMMKKAHPLACNYHSYGSSKSIPHSIHVNTCKYMYTELYIYIYICTCAYIYICTYYPYDGNVNYIPQQQPGSKECTVSQSSRCRVGIRHV